MKYGIFYAYWERQWAVDYVRFMKKAKDLGFDIMEIQCAGLTEMSEDDIKRLVDAKHKYGIELTAGYGPSADQSMASDDAAVVKNGLEYWKKTFKVFQKLGITQVGGGLYGYWPVDYSKPIDKEKDLHNSIQNMKTLANIALEHGVVNLGMEVLNRHEGYLLNTAKEARAYVEAVNKPNVKIMLDTYHMLLEEDSFYDAVCTAGEYLGHVHVGENNRKLPGQGKYVPWDELANALHEIHYTGTVVMEPFVIHGGQIGQDIRIWRDLIDDQSDDRLDADAKQSLVFLKHKMER